MTFLPPRIDIVFVNVAHFAYDRIQLSHLVSAPCQVDQFPDPKLGGGGRLQAAVHIVRVREPVPW